jgi:acyl dehydratase
MGGMTTTIDGIDGLKAAVGQHLGYSDYVEITQDQVNLFADATGDHQWIHVDVERAKKEMPGGKTIAHGYLTLSLLPRLAPTLMKIEKRRRGLNYGSNRVRFTAPVPAGARVRLRQKLVKVEPVEDSGFRITSEMTMEVEGNSRPAMVAETLGIVYG